MATTSSELGAALARAGGHTLTRRGVLRAAGLAVGGLALAGLTPPGLPTASAAASQAIAVPACVSPAFEPGTSQWPRLLPTPRRPSRRRSPPPRGEGCLQGSAFPRPAGGRHHPRLRRHRPTGHHPAEDHGVPHGLPRPWHLLRPSQEQGRPARRWDRVSGPLRRAQAGDHGPPAHGDDRPQPRHLSGPALPGYRQHPRDLRGLLH